MTVIAEMSTSPRTIGTSIAARGAGAAVTNQSVTNTNRMVGAFHSIPAPIVNVDVDVSAMSVTRQVTTVTRSTRTSSRTGDDYGGGP